MAHGRDLVREVLALGWGIDCNQAGPLLEQMLAHGSVELEDSMTAGDGRPYLVQWWADRDIDEPYEGRGHSVFEAALQCISDAGLQKPKE